MKPLEIAFWFVVFFTLSLMANAVRAQAAAADEPTVAITMKLPASKAAKCATEGCLILTEEEAEQLVQEALQAHQATCRPNHEA